MKKVIIVVVVMAVVLGIVFWTVMTMFAKPKPQEKKDVTLEVVGLWEEEKLLKPAIEEYKKKNPKITVKYTRQSADNYRSRMNVNISSNSGPDVFMIHNTWTPMFLKSDGLYPAPASVYKFEDYSKDFYPVVKDSFSKNGKIYAIPRGIDALVMYYNEDLLKSAGVPVPATWEQFVEAVKKLTTGDIYGAAIGYPENVDHWSDLLGLLFMQDSRIDPADPTKATTIDKNDKPAVETIKWYTNFLIDPKVKAWDKTMPPSTQAFASGRVAFYFAPSWRAVELRAINRELKFRTAPVPQISTRSKNQAGWGTFWGYAVNNRSKNPIEAWEFVKFLTSAETQKLLYQEAANTRLFGLPYSRVELKKEIEDDPVVGAVVKQGPYLKSWYLADDTQDGDDGIDDPIIVYYKNALIDITDKGVDPVTTLDTVGKGVKQVLDKYNKTAAASAVPK